MAYTLTIVIPINPVIITYTMAYFPSWQIRDKVSPIPAALSPSTLSCCL